MTPGDYRIRPAIQFDGYASADGIYVNLKGEAFIGEIKPLESQEGDHINNTSGYCVLPYCDDEGDYIPAPAGWEASVEQVLVEYV